MPARADVAVFDTGRILEIRSAEWKDGFVTLHLASGGEITVSGEKVTHVLADEVPPFEPETARPAPLYDHIIARAAARHGLDAALVRAVVRVESNFNPAAVSRAGAMGLMQLMPFTAKHYGVANPFDPETNLDAGARHMSGLLEKYSLEHALAAYNAGEPAVARYGGVPPFRETRDYVRRVLDYYGAYRSAPAAAAASSSGGISSGGS
jgi:soluble lytic murein transglycosylase-like protein